MKGTTLIELMLALLISMLILSSLTAVYLATKKIIQTQEALTTILENSNIAIFLLNSDLKMAGYMGCAAQDKNLVIKNKMAWESINKNKIQPYYTSDIKPDSEGFTVYHADKENAFLLRAMLTSSLLYSSDKPFFSEGDLLIITDCKMSELFFVNKVIKENTGIQEIIPEKPLSQLYGQGAKISRFDIHTYFIGKTPRYTAFNDPIYALYRLDQRSHKKELVEGVNNMKIDFTEVKNNQVVERPSKEMNPESQIIGVSIMLTFVSLNAFRLQKNEYIYVSI
ncbi:MAG: hypothetical protein K0S27_74 [Gammaproteobacteria bacterium]|jgi:hypothetical protein|nr:hypothetical protein [Gammaproteobacteria bacterium]